MKTFIVPTDFSETAKNAAIFAAELAGHVTDTEVKLYYEFDNFLAGSDSSPLAEEPQARQQIAELALENVRTAMLARSPGISVTYEAREDDSFLDGIEKFIVRQRPELVVMGISESSGIEQAFVKSNSLKVVDKNLVPVMIIPPKAHFKGISNILFDADFNDVPTTFSAGNIKRLLSLFTPFIHVVHVDESDMEPQRLAAARSYLSQAIEGYAYDFHHLRQGDFVTAINQFVADKNIDMIITFSKKNSFFTRLFQPNHAKLLAYNSYVPVVAIPAEPVA